MRAKKIVIISLLIILVLMLLSWLLIHECAYGAGMAATYKSCDCLGREWELYDQTAADGPRRTLCIGIVQSTTCHQYVDGPKIECETR